ncbi:hypothetical protein V6N13_094479 [Hibiscus sabdariffa]
MFSAILWNIWRQRNDRVFNNVTDEWGSIITRSKWLAATSAAAAVAPCNQSSILSGSIAVGNLVVHWNPPTDGWLKLNTDVARSPIDGRASCEGVLRDHEGNWIQGFTKFIGRCSVVETELWGIATGMELAWLFGCWNLIVESDSADALRMLQRRSPKNGPFTITNHLFQLCNKDWRTEFSKVARRNNGVADGLAKLASDASFDVNIFYEPSTGMEAN